MNRKKTREKISHIVTTTRIRTSKMVKFWKHIGQIIWERVPVLSPLQELISGKGFVSDVAIIRYSISRRGRVIIVCTEGIFAYILIVHGSHILNEAREHLSDIFFHFLFPTHLSIQMVSLMIVMSIGSVGYYGMIKPGDFRQAIKEHEEENEEINN